MLMLVMSVTYKIFILEFYENLVINVICIVEKNNPTT